MPLCQIAQNCNQTLFLRNKHKIEKLFLAMAIVLVLKDKVESAEAGYFFLFAIERFSEDYKFESISSFFISEEELYVADNGGKRIYVFDLEGNPIFQFGKEKGLGQPIDMFVYENQIYVTQEGKSTIDIYNIRGDLIREIDPPFEGFVPDRMALRDGGGFFVVDRRSFKICAFDKNGKYLYNFGGRNVFRSMGGITSKGEKIYITVMDSTPLIRTFDLKGKFISGFGQIGESRELFSMPAGINIDDDGNIWVVDAFKHKATAFNQEGKMQAELGSFGHALGSLYYPQKIDFYGDLYLVLEKESNRISVFQKED